MIAAVAVPLYRTSLDWAERIALAQCCKVLGRHDIVFIAPEALDLSNAMAVAAEAGVSPRVERFGRRWFRSTETYNALMLARSFYARFAAYNYILVYQLDCFVFRDELDRYCAMGYDYMGAPWLHDRTRPADRR